MVESEKTLDKEVLSLRDDVVDLIIDLILYGKCIQPNIAFVQTRSTYLLLEKNFRPFSNIDVAYIDITFSRDVFTRDYFYYTTLTIIQLEKQGKYVFRTKYAIALPEEKCRFVQKYGYENIEFSEIEAEKIVNCVDTLQREVGIYEYDEVYTHKDDSDNDDDWYNDDW